MTDAIIHFNGSADELESTIKAKKGLVVVDFFATWCGPCKRLGQILPGIATENSDVTFIKVDIDQNDDAASKFGVSSIPHIAFCKANDGNYEVINTVVGCNVEAINKLIAANK
ncbi:Thioredoxin family protein [Trichomonas vaginalis G3]|uniref:Thioredoxin n=1 Tax=Trichomonas vaginalis (strain ATCC PRA-98 / G3) TaxID=412133 RepID=A2F5G9_TRIV3|nr:cell redox homeostasis [Trichomonas vaginalis G3]EAX99841.1 Thioredoxin family protein [Trichomonas vaginalis G3]KAI5547681.1 cell redox homeostasis [Trichomonas vaginalis G3]|eukprot:XP_001312771.1 Thioredoxin family protein [Trichomonas vaginalis G3]